MKIAMIGQKRIPSREGGVEIHVEQIAVRMAAKGHDVTVYNRRKKGFPFLHEYKGVKIINVPTVNVKSLDAVLYSFFATIHTLFGHYDVIHYHAEGPCSMLWIPHLFGIKTVATIHGLDWQRAKWGGFATKFLQYGEKTAAKYADEVIVLSKNVQKYFMDAYGRETKLIPNGVNPPVIRNADIISKKYGLHKNDYLLFLARIVPEKGLHYLLEAFAEIDTDKRLVIAGGSSHSDDYVEKIRKMAGSDGRVVMTGFVQGQELDELFSNAFLYILPSNIEGMSISLLEAMSYGCSCLISDIPENIEVVQRLNQFYTFKAGNVGDLKEKLSRYLCNKNNEKWIPNERLRDDVLKYFSWESTVQKILAQYQ